MRKVRPEYSAIVDAMCLDTEPKYSTTFEEACLTKLSAHFLFLDPNYTLSPSEST